MKDRIKSMMPNGITGLERVKVQFCADYQLQVDAGGCYYVIKLQRHYKRVS
jgi:hypothetical protein